MEGMGVDIVKKQNELRHTSLSVCLAAFHWLLCLLALSKRDDGVRVHLETHGADSAHGGIDPRASVGY